jgi:ubiquinone/menaquinone biosynthesis C-methylase UbiE
VKISRTLSGRAGIVLLLAAMIAASAGTARAQTAPMPAHHGFQDTKRWAKIFESPERAKWQKPDEVVKALALKPGDDVADIGAGTGYFTRRFARAVAPGGIATGLDVEPGMVEYMKHDAEKLRLKNYRARLVKPDDPELKPDSVNLVFFCDVLHHVSGRVAYLKRLQPALKPGGRIAMVDFKSSSPIGPPARMRIPPAEAIKEFRQAGYRPVREFHFLPYQYFIEFAPIPGAAEARRPGR